MKTIYVQYSSKNRITFHHSRTILDEEQNNIIPSSSHYACELFYLLSGSVEYLIEGKSYKLFPHNVLLVPPNTLHSVQIDRSQPYERMVLLFPTDLIPTLVDLNVLSVFNSAKSFTFILPKSLVEKSKILDIFKEIRETCRKTNDKYVDLQLICLIIKMIIELTETSRKLKESSGFKSNASIINENVFACTQYIEKNINSALSIDDVAKALNISASRLSHIFKNELGISLKKYITHQKLYLAQKLLQQGIPPQEVAESLGYEYYSTFYQQYIKRFRISPSSQASGSKISFEDRSFDDEL